MTGAARVWPFLTRTRSEHRTRTLHWRVHVWLWGQCGLTLRLHLQGGVNNFVSLASGVDAWAMAIQRGTTEQGTIYAMSTGLCVLKKISPVRAPATPAASCNCFGSDESDRLRVHVTVQCGARLSHVACHGARDWTPSPSPNRDYVNRDARLLSR